MRAKKTCAIDRRITFQGETSLASFSLFHLRIAMTSRGATLLKLASRSCALSAELPLNRTATRLADRLLGTRNRFRASPFKPSERHTF